jgi:hypothetical protein
MMRKIPLVALMVLTLASVIFANTGVWWAITTGVGHELGDVGPFATREDCINAIPGLWQTGRTGIVCEAR